MVVPIEWTHGVCIGSVGLALALVAYGQEMAGGNKPLGHSMSTTPRLVVWPCCGRAVSGLECGVDQRRPWSGVGVDSLAVKKRSIVGALGSDWVGDD